MSEKKPPIEWCVAGTLAWFGVLGRALTAADLESLLLRRTAERPEIEKTLGRLGAKVTERRGMYRVRGASIRQATVKSDRAYRFKWWRVRVAASLLRHVPFIRMVAVGNTLADRTASPESDIDLFIVTDPRRLFTARTITTVLLQVFGLRRHGRKVRDRMCLSFWVTEKHLGLSDIAFAPYDIYLAYWIAELRPVVDAGETYPAFLDANRWVGELVPRYDSVRFETTGLSRVARHVERLLGSRAGDWIEQRLAGWQLKRIDTGERKGAPEVRIVADRTMLKFHEKERRKAYRDEWELLMRSLDFDPKRIK
ncbi:MAG: hypothetical protein M3N59_00020 [bacterium]|nr:hypothetical protein [bacterium]